VQTRAGAGMWRQRTICCEWARTRPSESSNFSNIQGTVSEHSGNIQGTFKEHSVNIQGTVREYSGKFQSTLQTLQTLQTTSANTSFKIIGTQKVGRCNHPIRTFSRLHTSYIPPLNLLYMEGSCKGQPLVYSQIKISDSCKICAQLGSTGGICSACKHCTRYTTTATSLMSCVP
jgi:hypothetical protein